MRLSFLVSAGRQPQPYEFPLTKTCFSQFDIADMKVLTFIGDFISNEKYGDYTPDEFAELFLQAFETKFGKENYGIVEQVHFLAGVVDYSRVDTSTLVQKIVNALFIRGFYNLCGKNLMRPQSTEPLSIVYFVYDDIKFYYSTCSDNSPESLELILIQFTRFQDKRKLQKAITEAETPGEKNNFEIASKALDAQIIKEHAELKNKILDCSIAIDAALNHPNNPHHTPYNACEDSVTRKELCLELKSVYLRRKTLQTDLSNATILSKDYFYRTIKRDKIQFLTNLLESNDLESLRKKAELGLTDGSTFGKNVRHGRLHSETAALLERIARPR